jgi:hypothetical protein
MLAPSARGGSEVVLFRFDSSETPDPTASCSDTFFTGKAEPIERNSAKADPIERSPIEWHCAEAEPIERSPVEWHCAEAEPVERNSAEALERRPIERNSAEAEPIERNSAEAEPIERNSAEAEPIKAQPAKAEPVEADGSYKALLFDRNGLRDGLLRYRRSAVLCGRSGATAEQEPDPEGDRRQYAS